MPTCLMTTRGFDADRERRMGQEQRIGALMESLCRQARGAERR